LLQHAVPGVVAGVGQGQVLAQAPLLEQHSRRVFTTKKGGESLFEGAAKQHRCACVFFLPTIEVSVPVTARTAQVLADLSVGVRHWDASSVLEREAPDTG